MSLWKFKKSKITSEEGATMSKGQSTLYKYEIAIAYIVLPTPISSPNKSLPNFSIPN